MMRQAAPRHPLFFFAVMSWLLLCSSGLALADSWELQRAKALEAEIAAQPAHPLVYAKLLWLDEHTHLIPLSEHEALLNRLAELDLPANAAAWVGWQQAELALNRGQWAQSEAQLEALGFIKQWWVMGAFANEGMSGFDEIYPPEDAIDMADRWEGKTIDLQWRYFETKGRSGYLRVSSLISPTFDTVSYMTTVLESPEDQEALLWLSVDGAYKVWLDEALLAVNEDDLGGELDREVIPVQLKKGPNQLLIKIANESGYAGLFARLTDRQGKALLLPQSSIEPARSSAVEQEPTSYEPVSTPLLEMLDALALQEEPSAYDQALVAFAHDRILPQDSTNTARNLMLDALAQGSLDPQVVALAVAVLDEPWRTKKLVLDALELEPENPILLSFKAAQLLSDSAGLHDKEIDQLLDRLEAEISDSVGLALMRAEWYSSLAMDQSAFELLLESADKHPEVAELLSEISWRAGSLERARERAALEALLALRANFDSTRIELASLLVESGELERAIEVLDEGLAARPDARSLALMQVEIFDSLARFDDSEGIYKALIEQVPTSSDHWQSYGDWLLERGRTEEALAAYRSALNYEAQNEELRQLVRYLDPGTASFEQPYLIEDVTNYGFDPLSEDYTILIDQKITQVHDNGLSSVFVQTVYQAHTDEGASALRNLVFYYTPGEEVLDFDKVQVLKADGSLREVYERSEYSVADPSIRMYYDYRQVVLEIPDLTFGDVVEVRYRRSEVQASNYFDDQFGDVWFMQDTVPKGFVRYVLMTPEELEVRWRLPESYAAWLEEGSASMQEELAEGQKIAQFERWAVPKVEVEGMMPGWAEVADYIQLSTFSSWGEVGKWYWNLAKDQWVIDKEMRETVTQLVEGVDDRRERVSKIHNYVVKNTRYVALEFGVHGYKPYKTTVCFSRKFGDCKDKASLLKVMLEEAGIPANIVLIRTQRNGDIATDPPNVNIFDHAIAYVPEFDLFLDGTAEFSGTTELPAMDQGSILLIVKDEGEYELRHAPVFDAEANQVIKDYAFELSLDGSAQVTGQSEVKGQMAPSTRQTYEATERRLERFENEFSSRYPGAEIGELTFSGIEALEDAVQVRFTAKVPDILQESGSTWETYPLGQRSDLAQRLASQASRKQDLVISFPFRFTNHFKYTLPDGLQLTAIDAVEMNSDFGAFTLAVSQEGRELVVESTIEISQIRISKDDYPAFKAFMLDIDRTLNTPLVFTLEGNEGDAS